MKDDEDSPSKFRRISYSVLFPNDLHSKIEKHLREIQNREYNTVTKQKWIIDALQERLEKKKNIPEQLPKGKFVSIRIDERLLQEIANETEKLKVIQAGYSKRKWIIDAVCAKLDRELEEKD